MSQHPSPAEAHRPPPWRRPLVARDPSEGHRAASPLELLFDLCFVVAVAQASAKLHHGLVEGHVAHALLAYVLVFFAIWWSWMGFTWLASAYDNDDAPYRLKAFVQIVGVLIIAAGIPRAFDATDFGLVTLGYAVMRVGLVATWLRAGHADRPHEATVRRYVLGILAVQGLWVAMLFLPAKLWLAAWPLAVLAELAVPWWAERAGATPWHPHHIAERYGLLTLIVLGESILAATLAIQKALDAGHGQLGLLGLVVGGLLILFSTWWIYFEAPPQGFLSQGRGAFAWGYGHALVFAALAALGSGLGANTDALGQAVHLGPVGLGLALALPCAIFVALAWLLLLRPRAEGAALKWPFLGGALGAIACAWSPAPALALGLLMAALAAWQAHHSRRSAHGASPAGPHRGEA